MKITSGQALDATGAGLLTTVGKIYRQDDHTEFSKGCNQMNGDGIYNFYPPFTEPDGIVEVDGPPSCAGVRGFLSQLVARGEAQVIADPDSTDGGQRLVTTHPFV